MRSPRSLSRRARAGAVVVVALAGGSALAAPALAATPRATSAPPRVTVLSGMIDIFEFGGQVGFAEVYGLGESTLLTVVPPSALPPQLRPVGDQVIVITGIPPQKVFPAMADYGTQGLESLRAAIAPLAALNAPIDQGIDATTGVIDKVVNALHPAIAPADITILQLDQFARDLEEH